MTHTVTLPLEKKEMLFGLDRLVWVDIETTGLDAKGNLLLEVGFKITDLNLETLDEKDWVIWGSEYDSFCIESNIDSFVWEMHRKSGLWHDAKQNGLPPTLAKNQINEWLLGHKISSADPLCGSSVQFDRRWLDVHMPAVTEQFSYRNIDTSSIKELCRRYNPELYAKLDESTNPVKLHRAMSDLDDTVNEFGFYLENFLFWRD